MCVGIRHSDRQQLRHHAGEKHEAGFSSARQHKSLLSSQAGKTRVVFEIDVLFYALLNVRFKEDVVVSDKSGLFMLSVMRKSV